MTVEIKPLMGRPPKDIDWKLFESLCKIHCTHDELSSVLEVSKATLYERTQKQYSEDFPTIYKRFCDGGKASLRRIQFKQAEKNTSMAIWLGKVYLGQKDTDDPEHRTVNNYTINVSPDGLASGLPAATIPTTDNTSTQ